MRSITRAAARRRRRRAHGFHEHEGGEAPDIPDGTYTLAARALPPPDDRWRARGLAFFDLPLGLRARYEARALHPSGLRQDGSAVFAEHLDAENRRVTRLLESRFALTHVMAPHVELEFAWSTRSPLSMVDLIRIQDQRVAAMIRFTP